MSIDTSKIGTVAAEVMEELPQEADGEIVAVGIVVIVDSGEETYTRTKTSVLRRYEQVGLWWEALDVAKHGVDVGEE